MRSYKLDEFVAHSGTVNCLRIGRNTAGVLVTGGEDKKVNLWRIGQPHVAKSLSGLQSAVECVTFDGSENQVAAGGANGTVKVWDLESGKVSRSLTGHRSNCLTLEFHPLGPLLATGSLDTNVKVWDLRRKEAITTFKGHTKGVKQLAISPDGKWVCSGSENGEIKLWDTAQGRVIKDGWSHDNSITGIEFHPYEFILATSSTDKTVRIWDLETWEPVESLGPEATAVKAIAYHKDGRQLLSATADALKVWGCEPAVHHDTVPIDWRQLADMHLSYKDDQPRVVGCCCSMSAVGVFLVDLRKVAPFCTPGTADTAVGAIGGGGGRHLQHLAAAPRAADSHKQQQEQQLANGLSGAPRAGVSGSNSSSSHYSPCGAFRTGQGAAAGVDGKLAAAAAEQGPMTRQLCRQRTPPGHAAPGGAPLDKQQAGGDAGRVKQNAFGSGNSREHLQALQPGQLQPAADSAQQQQQQQAVRRKTGDMFPEFEIRVPLGPPPARLLEQPVVSSSNVSSSRVANRLSVPNSSGSSAVTSRQASQFFDADAAASAVRQLGIEPLPLPSYAAHTASSSSKVSPRGGASSRSLDPSADAGLALDAAAGISVHAGEAAERPGSKAPSREPSPRGAAAPTGAGAYGSRGFALGRDSAALAAAAAPAPSAPPAPSGMLAASPDPITAAMAQLLSLKADLVRMAAALQVARGFVARGNLDGAYKAVLSQEDAATACMLVEAVQGRQDAFELASLEPLLKLLELLLASGQEQQQGVGLGALSLVLRGPGQLVRDVCGAPTPSGVDLSYEARRNRCLLVKMALEGLGMKVGVLARGGGPLAGRAQLVAEELRHVVA